MKSSGPRKTTGGWERKDARNLNSTEKALIRKLKKAGYGRNAIANKLGRGYATISRYLRTNGEDDPLARTVYWTPEEDRRLIHLHNEGKSQVQIAEALGRSRGAVGVRLSVHRKAALEGTELQYSRTNAAESPKRAPKAVGAAFAEVPEPITVNPLGAIGLARDLDLWAIWERRVFGGASQL
jgi:IS30 family transposase